MEALLHLFGVRGRERGAVGLWGGLCASPHPISPSAACSTPPRLQGEVDSMLPVGQGVGVEVAEAGGMFSSAEHSSFGPGPVPRGKINSG